MDINSLPSVSDAQLRAMEKNAQEKFGVEEQVIEQPPQEQQPIEQHVSSEEQPQESPHKKTPAESFSELKAKADRHARERDEYAQKIREYERILQQQQQTAQPQKQEQPQLNIGADDIAEGKHIIQLQQELQEMKRQQQEAYQKNMLAMTESRLKAQYNDFDKVVSSENLQLLSYTYPELAHTLNSATDIYSKAVSAYTMIKQMGIYKNDIYDADKKRVQENSMKPRLSPAVNVNQGDTPLSKAHMFAEDGLTPELKQQLLKEMVAARNKM